MKTILINIIFIMHDLDIDCYSMNKHLVAKMLSCVMGHSLGIGGNIWPTVYINAFEKDVLNCKRENSQSTKETI
jgi:hypothetical protein